MIAHCSSWAATARLARARNEHCGAVDQNQYQIDGGVPASLTGPNSAVAIDPNKLPAQLFNGVCSPVWPHNLVRANTIFDVIHRHHLRTAWSDKHPA
jgi:hypothetical protein